MSAQANPELDPETALVNAGQALELMRLAWHFKRLGLNAHENGKFLAEGWWGKRECGSAWGDTPASALQELCAKRGGSAR